MSGKAFFKHLGGRPWSHRSCLETASGSIQFSVLLGQLSIHRHKQTSVLSEWPSAWWPRNKERARAPTPDTRAKMLYVYHHIASRCLDVFRRARVMCHSALISMPRVEHLLLRFTLQRFDCKCLFSNAVFKNKETEGLVNNKRGDELIRRVAFRLKCLWSRCII